MRRCCNLGSAASRTAYEDAAPLAAAAVAQLAGCNDTANYASYRARLGLTIAPYGWENNVSQPRTALDRLAEQRYVLLTTFRKDGRAVATPVVAARDGDALAIWSVADAGKVKRIRRSGHVTVAPCDMRGNPRGEAVAGQATLTDQATTRRLLKVIARKYGLMGWITTFSSRLRRGRAGLAGIHVTFAD